MKKTGSRKKSLTGGMFEGLFLAVTVDVCMCVCLMAHTVFTTECHAVHSIYCTVQPGQLSTDVHTVQYSGVCTSVESQVVHSTEELSVHDCIL